MIHETKLPPKPGYVEVETEDGGRTYMNAVTGVLIDDEVSEVSDHDVLNILIGYTE